MKYCSNPYCDDWAENIEIIDGPLVLSQIRSGKQVHLKTFVYCPWCGQVLADRPIPEVVEMKYVRLKNSLVYHRRGQGTIRSWHIGFVCTGRIVDVEKVELTDRPPKLKGFPGLYRPCKRCFKDDAIEAAIEESDRISRELDDVGKLRPSSLDEEIK